MIDDQVEAAFAPDGVLAASDPRFEPRPQQTRMALAVSRALDGNGRLVVEAPTGVGKSLAYLLPGALWAVGGGRRLLVSTYTRALQEQIIDKDLPIVAEALRRMGLALRYSMLQGSENYLCVQRLERCWRRGGHGPDSRAALERLVSWASRGASGHRSRLPSVVPQPLWARISRDPERCAGSSGRYWDRCLYRKDRQGAEQSHILVVNHALLLSGARLPAFDGLVVDEAHNLEETATSHYGQTVSESALKRLLLDLEELESELPAVKGLASGAAKEARAFFGNLAEALELPRSPAESASRVLQGGERVPAPLFLDKLAVELGRLGEELAEREESIELRMFQGRISGISSAIKGIFACQAPEIARWAESSHAGMELKALPLEVGERLAEGLFSRDIPVVLASATLSAGSGLKEFKAHVGLQGAEEFVVDSPFDYEGQAALLLIEDLPEPSDDPSYFDSIAGCCQELIEAVAGGLFILFSSWKALREVHERLKARVNGRPIWMQGDSGHEALIQDFARAGDAVLLGVDTLWQGVDVPGGALSCVVMVKLPFPQFGSPMEESRRRWHESIGRNYFESYSLPRALMKFRQGFGRLIRSSHDRGAVVVLDPRLLRRRYGPSFLEVLPRCRRLESISELRQFLSGKARVIEGIATKKSPG